MNRIAPTKGEDASAMLSMTKTKKSGMTKAKKAKGMDASATLSMMNPRNGGEAWIFC
ncbi:MAG: hypothetical protein HGB19_00575 [Chlorobiales bacterium]|nr:hypothetical protein [Chlorobiales bacterium]